MISATAHSFLYVETDIPAGVTIPQWRSSRPAARSRLARLFGR